MPWTPGFQPDRENVREALSDAIVGLLQNNLVSLNAALGPGGIVPVLPGPPQLSVGSIILGDVDTMPDLSTGAFWCQVVAGGERDARDAEIELESSPASYKYIFSTNVDFYVQGSAFSVSDAFLQASYRERLRLRLTDWLLFAVFNSSSALSLTLNSQTFEQPNDVSQLTVLAEIAAGYVDRSFGGTLRVYHLHNLVRTEIHGSVG